MASRIRTDPFHGRRTIAAAEVAAVSQVKPFHDLAAIVDVPVADADGDADADPRRKYLADDGDYTWRLVERSAVLPSP